MVHTLGARLKEVRVALECTQSGIAEKVGSKLRSWQDYENDKRSPGSLVMEGLARLGVNTNYLLTGDGPMFTADPEGHRLMVAETTGNSGGPEQRERHTRPFMERLRRSTATLEEIRDGLGYDPGQPWNSIIQEMLVAGQLTEEGAYTLIARLRTMDEVH